MNKLTQGATRLLVFALGLGLAATAWAAVTTTDYTGTDFVNWSYTTVYQWTPTVGSLGNFSSQSRYKINSSGNATSDTAGWTLFCSGQTGYSAPGYALYIPETTLSGACDVNLDWGTVVFGGMWVKTAGITFTSTASYRGVAFGDTDGTTKTYFVFDKGITFSTTGGYTFYGPIDMTIASSETLDVSGSVSTVNVNGNLKLAGDGTLKVSTLTVNGSLNKATTATLSGDVTLAEGSTIVLPSGTATDGTAINVPVCSGTLTVPSGTVNVKVGDAEAIAATLTAANGAITRIDTVTEFTFTSDYPSVVPTGLTYIYVGSDDSANPSNISSAVTVSGTLKTKGYISFSNLQIAQSGTLEVVSETATVATTTRSNGEGNLSGRIIIDAGATMVNQTTDGLDWDGTTCVDIYGTLSMGSTRWSIRQAENCTVNLYMGAQVTGAGDGNGVLDLFNDSSKLNCYATGTGAQATISGPVRFRGNNQYPIWVASGAKLVLSGGTLGNGGFSANGPGEIVLSGSSLNHTGSSLVSDGTVTFDNTTQAKAITVNSGKTLKVIATSTETSVPLDATLAADTCTLTFEGSGYANGTIKEASYFAVSSAQKTFLQDSTKWRGSFEIPAYSTAFGFPFNDFGNSYSKIVLDGLSNGQWTGWSDNILNVAPEVVIAGNVTFNNGSSGKTQNLGVVSGTNSDATFKIGAWSGSNSSLTFSIGELNEFPGTLELFHASSHSTPVSLKLTVGNIVKAAATVNTPILKYKETKTGSTGTITGLADPTTLSAVTVNGETPAYTLIYDTVDNISGIYYTVATYGGKNYGSVANAITAYEEDATVGKSLADIHVLSALATIPAGYALVTAAGGAMTLRTAGAGESIYWAAANSGDWSGETSNGTHTFYTDDGATTPYVSGDTVVITNNTQIWSKTAAHGAKFQIGTDSQTAEVHFTRSGDNCDDYILDGSTVEVKAGSALVVERYGLNGNTYNAWDSYQNAHPDASSIRNTTVTGAGILKIGGDTGGHGAVAAVLSGTTISCAIDLAAGATLDAPAGCTVTTPTTSVANSYVKLTGSTYSVDAYKTVTIVAGDSTVAVSTNGVVVAGSSPYALEAGTISIAVTPTAGYKVTGVSASSGEVTGAGPYEYTLAGDVTITVATEAMGAAVSNVNFTYGADYATATVTAIVSGDATGATLNYNGATYTSNVGAGGAVTFEDVVVPARGNDIYAPVGYTITAKNGDSTITTTDGSGSAPVADVVNANWINENATTHGQAAAGGSWTNAAAVTYSEGKAAISDNRFVATEASTASHVVLEFEVCFSSTSADDVSGEAQAAIKLGEDNNATTFMVLTTANAWEAVSNAELEPNASATYNVVLAIDYGNNTYGVTVGNYVMTNSTGSASFSLATSKATVKNIDFVGSGTLTSIKGDQIEGYMVVDKNGTRYVSIAAAISAYLNDPTIAPLTVLHDGTAPSGWKIVTEGGVDILKKVAKGLFFMAY